MASGPAVMPSPIIWRVLSNFARNNASYRAIFGDWHFTEQDWTILREHWDSVHIATIPAPGQRNLTSSKPPASP